MKLYMMFGFGFGFVLGAVSSVLFQYKSQMSLITEDLHKIKIRTEELSEKCLKLKEASTEE